ncbi:MAG: DUF2442 domain-containing protein [Pseudomonadota bacterium]
MTSWFTRLADASQADREAFELIGGGEGIHWLGLDEDRISLSRPSAERAGVDPR